MATDADVWEDTLEKLFERISEIPTYWRDKPRPFEFVDAGEGAAVCLLEVVDDAGVGVDEYRIEIDGTQLASSPPVEVEPCAVGLRTTRLQVLVETWDQDAKRRARHFLERIRRRIRLPSTLATLRKIDTAHIRTERAILSARLQDNRDFSTGAMSILLHTISVEPDKPFGRIDQVDLEGTLTGPDGSPAATSTLTIDLPDP